MEPRPLSAPRDVHTTVVVGISGAPGHGLDARYVHLSRYTERGRPTPMARSDQVHRGVSVLGAAHVPNDSLMPWNGHGREHQGDEAEEERACTQHPARTG